MDDSPQDVYARCLPNNRGYPLWFPEPSSMLPSSYKQDGLQIGDVGYVSRKGTFNVLFNICHGPNHALHRRPGVSFRFDPIALDIDHEVDVIANADPPACIITSPGITQPSKTPQRAGHYEFIPSSAKGAILILPDGATSHDLPANERFRKLAVERAFDWYEMAKEHYGESISSGSLYLITGFYKARSWSLASFHDATATEPQHIRVVPREGEGTTTGRDWKCTFPVQYRDGPGPGRNGNVNQTVFISGFKIAVRDDVLGWLSPKPEIQPVPAVRPRKGPCRFGRFLTGLFGKKNTSKQHRRANGGADVDHVPTLSQPFHPSDVINRFLLNQDPDALVAVTHDSQWIDMIETGKLAPEDLAREDRLEKLLSENYILTAQPENSERGISGKQKPGIQHEPSFKMEKNWYPTPSSHQSHIVITRIRAEDVATGLRRIPSGFSVLVEFDGSQRRTKNKPVRLDESITEWDDLTLLPSESSANIRLAICASFEMSPMLGKGEILFKSERSVAEWTDNVHPITFSPEGGTVTSCRCSLLITVERQTLNYSLAASCQISNLDWEGSSELARQTDLGHDALLQYRNDPRKESLDRSLQYFQRAQEICPLEHRCRVAVLRNLAMAKFFHCQVTGAYADLEVSTSLYREALDSCATGHPDRPATLLHLVQALVYRYGKRGCEESVAGEIKELVAEIQVACPGNTHEHRAAELILQTCKRYGIIYHGDRTELNELISVLYDASKVPPDGYFDRPHRLYNLTIALRERFEVYGELKDLDESIAANEKAVELTLPGDPDCPEVLTTLGASFLRRFECIGDVTSLEKSVAVNEKAVRLTLDGHLARRELLSSYGIALLRRLEQADKPGDLDKSFSALEEAVPLAPLGHPSRPQMLLNLGNISFSRFQRFGELGDLDKSVSAVQEAIQLIPDNQLNRPELLATLSTLLHTRFRLLGIFDNLQQSILIAWEAMLLIPSDHPSRPRFLGILGTSLLIRYQKHGELPDLAKSISVNQQALRRISDDHLSRDKMLTNLCTSILIGFQRFGRFDDLAKAMSVIDPDRIPRATQDGRFDQPELLSDLYAVMESFTRKGY